MSVPIPAGHKIALRPVNRGEPVHKYGQIIGFATSDIHLGDHVHTHNLAAADYARKYQPASAARALTPYPPQQMRQFQGYQRPDGRVGTRNYLAIISSVNCSASAAQYAARRFSPSDLARDYPHVDGIIPFTYKSGCTVQTGQPLDTLNRVLTGMAQHPNICGCIIIGLGCECIQVQSLARLIQLGNSDNTQPAPILLNIQDIGSLAKTVDATTAAIARLLPIANACRRTSQPISKLILAENCGGSDAHSGITANPALGVASDELVRYGGASVLAETPEIYGAEHLLVARATSPAVADELLALIRWWEDHVRIHGASIDNNPSPGNKAGGLTTIFEKSLGAVAKAGQAPLMAVYQYAQQIRHAGLCFMDTPGLDPVSMTGLVAGGCTIGCFTTGRGSVYGCKPSPCIKIATNTALYQHMIDDMDLNAGTLLDGAETLPQIGQRIFEMILAVAGGQKTKSEQQGLGDEEFAPWLLGPTF